MAKNQDIEKELKELHSDLGNIQYPDFQTPEGYFEQFGTSVRERIETENITDRLSKNMPYAIPDNYFNMLPGIVSQKIYAAHEIHSQGNVFKTSYFRIKNLSLAASILFILGLGIIMFYHVKPELSIEEQISLINHNEVLDYINEHKVDFQQNELLESYDLQNIDIQSLESDISNFKPNHHKS